MLNCFFETLVIILMLNVDIDIYIFSEQVCKSSGSVGMKHESRSLDSQRPLVETDDRQDSHLLEHLVEDEARQHERGQQQLLLVSTMPDTGCCLSTVRC